MVKVCTGSHGKLIEFQEFFGQKLDWIQKDLPEPDSDSITIIRFKASQFSEVLVDDTSLEVEGENIGTLIKWKMEELEKLEGRNATFICYLGISRTADIEIYKGEVSGKICQKDGEGFGFNPYFIPDGAHRSFAIDKPNEKNARFLAVQNFLSKSVFLRADPLPEWPGPFQKK